MSQVLHRNTKKTTERKKYKNNGTYNDPPLWYVMLTKVINITWLLFRVVLKSTSTSSQVDCIDKPHNIPGIKQHKVNEQINPSVKPQL